MTLVMKESGLATGSGNGRESVRRVGVTPLTRRCRARVRTLEQPGETKNIPVTKTPDQKGRPRGTDDTHEKTKVKTGNMKHRA